MANAQLINAKLVELFSNGKGEVGLEAGQDPGLPLEEFIQIPKSLERVWFARVKTQGQQVIIPGFPYDQVEDYSSSNDSAYYIGKFGYISTGVIRVNSGIVEGQMRYRGTPIWVEIDEFVIQAPTCDDLIKFYAANIDHIRGEKLNKETKFWIIAVRFWATVAGFVVTTKSSEYVVVADPTVIPADAAEFADFAMNFCANSWTACAARATSWRKTNHCTGGEVANGFPKRWLVKEGLWNFNGEDKQRIAHEKQMTTCLYVATHGVSSHAVLALMAPQDPNHWAIITPSFGFVKNWDVGQSVILRMIPNTQVAGTALVVDAMVVLRMLTSEGLSPFISTIHQLDSMMSAYDEVSKNGMRCAVYAKWYFEGFFKNTNTSAFSQRDSSFVDLLSELSIIAMKYYKDSTIAGSAALKNLMAQCSMEGIKHNWAAIASKRRDIDKDDFFRAFDFIKGNTSAPVIQQLISHDYSDVSAGVIEFNTQLHAIARKIGIDQVMILKIPVYHDPVEPPGEDE
jgi:hypothetical protein